MKKFFRLVIFVLFIKITNAQIFNPQLATMLQDTLDTYVSAISNIKGMSASVYIPGQGMWQGASGVSHTGQPITKDMTFGIASNSKLFTSTAMLMLAENNIISLDDSLYEWLPTYTNVDPNITIRQLLNHTSGISDPIFVSPWFDTINNNSTRVFTPAEVLSWLGAPTFAAGTSWGYSNVNYILAGMIAENATGYHISNIIRDSILTPLNMDSTFFDVEETERGVIAHRWWNTIDYHDTSHVAINSVGGAAGAIFSTSSEMSQWYRALLSGQILNASSMNELTSFVATAAPTQQYGLGLIRETTQGYTYWGHSGEIWGYRSKMMYDTCMGTVVCGLSNSFPSGIAAVTFLLYRVVKNHIPQCSGVMMGVDTVCENTNSVTYTIPTIANATSYTWILPTGCTGTSNTNSITVSFGSNAISGNIVVSGVNSYGIGGTTSLWVTVNPTPPTPVVSVNGNVLTSNATNGNQWYTTSGILTGETNQNYTATSTDDYYAIVTLLNCSSDTSNVIHVTPTGVDRNKNNWSVNVYPSPVLSQLTIEVKGHNETMYFEIINTLGQVVLKGNMSGKTSIQTGLFPAGVYFIKLSNGNSVELRKMIKE